MPGILGIDPGSRKCGYGVLGADGSYVTSGTLVLSGKLPLHERLKEIHEGLKEVIDEHAPALAVVEKVFFAKSVRSALVLGEARGVALFTAAYMGLEIREYSASEVKKAVTGYGRAEKGQVQEMVKSILGIRHALSPDGADALAIALCHMNMRKIEEMA